MYSQTNATTFARLLPQTPQSNYVPTMNLTLKYAEYTDDAQKLLQPETKLERAFLNNKNFAEGLIWGKPRFGHPEGKVVYHIREVLDNVEKLDIDADTRRQLRIITFVHDTFKHLEDRGNPRDWSKHHGALAANFLSDFTDEKAVLDITRWHDEAYYAWRAIHLYNKKEQGAQRLENMIASMGEHLQLYYLFFKCDTQTGDKIQAPVRWFEETVKGINVVKF